MKNWKNITLKQFNSIKDVLANKDEYTALNLLDLIYNINSADMTISDLAQYNNAIAFLSDPIPQVQLEKQYLINNTLYNSNIDLTVMTAAQFIDYQNYTKKENPQYQELLSVFFIPEGHSYNDGYDLSQVQQDILELDMPTVYSIAFFFRRQYSLLVELILLYSSKQIHKMKIPKKEKQILLQQIRAIPSINLDSFLL